MHISRNITFFKIYTRFQVSIFQIIIKTWHMNISLKSSIVLNLSLSSIVVLTKHWHRFSEQMNTIFQKRCYLFSEKTNELDAK